MISYAKTAILLAGLTGFFLVVGYMIGGEVGMLIALLVAVGVNFYAYFNADKAILHLNGAAEVDRSSWLYATVAQLAGQAGMPMPRVYLVRNEQPNAFATGRDPEHAAVAATSGLLSRLSQEEVAAVMAHELAHIQNRDTLIMTITATIAGAITMLANFGWLFRMFGGGGGRNNPFGIIGSVLMMIIAPIAAAVVQMAISRTREYEADRIGAEICRNPSWLAQALEKISGLAGHIDNPTAERNPAVAHMFIINPLRANSGRARLSGLFSTHPPTEERVQRLRMMSRS